MSPQMIQALVLRSMLREDDLSRGLIVPCLQAYSTRSGYSLRDVRFTGGASELGDDIEYYELLGPDAFRLYTGIQLKKENIAQADVPGLVRQGEEAFEKDVLDPAAGQKFRIGRWIVATFGSITDPAKREIVKRLERYGKPIHFWDGLRLADLIMQYYYREFVQTLGVEPILAASENVQTALWDPDNPIVVASNFSATVFTTVDVSAAVPPVAVGILLTVRPRDRNLPSVRCLVRSSTSEVVIDSLQSQLQPYLLRMGAGDSLQAMVVDASRPVDILARGYIDVI